MTRSPERQALLFRMEEARRQTQRQLDMIDRQITAKMTALVPSLGRRRSGYRRGKPPAPEAFLARYRSSLAAITGFHIVEHIGFKDLVRLFDEARRVLMPGGIVLFETPNPENLVVGACTFHYDPTHNKPLPPDYLRFVAEARGFDATRIIRIAEDCDLSQPESGFAPAEINDWFRQPPDYALYARKPLEDGQIEIGLA